MACFFCVSDGWLVGKREDRRGSLRAFIQREGGGRMPLVSVCLYSFFSPMYCFCFFFKYDNTSKKPYLYALYMLLHV